MIFPNGLQDATSGSDIMLPHVWRTVRVTRTLSWAGVVTAGFAMMILIPWVLYSPNVDHFIAVIICVLGTLGALLLWRYGIYPSVTVSEEGLEVRNPWETTKVRWSDVAKVKSDADGLIVTPWNAPPTTIWALQTIDLSLMQQSQARTDSAALIIRLLATKYGGLSRVINVPVEVKAEREAKPLDALERPLKFPWRMHFLEAITIDFVWKLKSWVTSAMVALAFAGLGVMSFGSLGGELWDANVLNNRGVIVQATVIEVPNFVWVTWPGIAADGIEIDGGDEAEERFTPGDRVEVRMDPLDPTRAHIVGYGLKVGEVFAATTVGLVSLFIANGYAKWSRWLFLASRERIPTLRNQPAGPIE